jgi:alanine-synthesizing transaminase
MRERSHRLTPKRLSARTTNGRTAGLQPAVDELLGDVHNLNRRREGTSVAWRREAWGTHLPPGFGRVYSARVFSRRSRHESRKNALALALERQPARYDLTQPNPTRTSLPYRTDELVRALDNPAARRYEPHPRGLLRARSAVGQQIDARLARARASRQPPAAAHSDEPERANATPSPPAFDPERVLLCSGTSEAYGFLFKLLCDPGDEVLIPEPSYPLFADLCRYEQVVTRPYPLHYDGQWHLGLGELGRAVSPRTRAILVVSPNNPTGSYLKRAELQALERLGLPIIADEVFADYPLRPDADRIWTAHESEAALVFALGGLSKQAGLPQWKVSWISMSGPEALVQEAETRLELIADTYLSVATPTQHAVPELLRASAPLQQAIQARLQRNLAVLRSALASCPAISLLDLEGGFYATLRLPRVRAEEQWVLEFLELDSVHVQPGYFFDFPGEAYVILSLLCDEPVFDAGTAAIVARVMSHLQL